MNVLVLAAVLACPGPHTPNYVHPEPHPVLMRCINQLNTLPVSIAYTSGVRCPAANIAKGSAPTSKHLLGQAVDVHVRPRHMLMVVFEALQLDMRVLVEDDHLHLDLGKPGSARLLIQTPSGWQPVGPAADWKSPP